MPTFQDLNIDPNIIELKEPTYGRVSVVAQPGVPIALAIDGAPLLDPIEAEWLQAALEQAKNHLGATPTIPVDVIQSNIATHAQPRESADPVHAPRQENIGFEFNRSLQ
jgi:hypothetical protein